MLKVLDFESHFLQFENQNVEFKKKQKSRFWKTTLF